MPKITDEPLVKIQLTLFKKDHEALRQIYGADFGVNRAIRTIIRTFITQTNAQADAKINASEAASAEGK
jgi:hypothetical protein